METGWLDTSITLHPRKNAASSKELCDVIRHLLQQKLALTDSTENLDH